jgi:hypothetical protein
VISDFAHRSIISGRTAISRSITAAISICIWLAIHLRSRLKSPDVEPSSAAETNSAAVSTCRFPFDMAHGASSWRVWYRLTQMRRSASTRWYRQGVRVWRTRQDRWRGRHWFWPSRAAWEPRTPPPRSARLDPTPGRVNRRGPRPTPRPPPHPMLQARRPQRRRRRPPLRSRRPWLARHPRESSGSKRAGRGQTGRSPSESRRRRRPPEPPFLPSRSSAATHPTGCSCWAVSRSSPSSSSTPSS